MLSMAGFDSQASRLIESDNIFVVEVQEKQNNLI